MEFWEVVDGQGQEMTRLFVNVGRQQGLGTQELLQLLQDEAGVDRSQVDNVQVKSSFSFLNVPSGDAERVLETLTGKQFNGREVRVERAKRS